MSSASQADSEADYDTLIAAASLKSMQHEYVRHSYIPDSCDESQRQEDGPAADTGASWSKSTARVSDGTVAVSISILQMNK